HGARLAWRAYTDGIAQRNFPAAQRVQTPCHTNDIVHRHIALVGAAEHGRYIATHAHIVGLRPRQYRREALDGLVNTGVDVFAVERFARRREHGDLFDTNAARPLVAAQIRYQHRII